ncbi:unnamed protein product, partial [Diamesa hyperborea]
HNTEILLTQGGSLRNSQGEISVENNFNLKGGLANNHQGLISSKNTTSINTQGEILNNNDGKIQAAGFIDIKSDNLHNKVGNITSENKINIESHALENNSGYLASNDGLNITSYAIDNSTGKILSKNSININSKEINNNSGEINVHNTSDKNNSFLNINTNNESIHNVKGKIIASGDQKIQASSLNNTDGKIAGHNTEILLTQGGSLRNSQGEISAKNNFNLKGGLANNHQGLISSKNTTSINTQGEILNNNYGKIEAVGGIQIISTDLNNSSGRIASGSTLKIKSNSIDNSSGEIIVNNEKSNKEGFIEIHTNNNSLLNNKGEIIASGDQKIEASSIDNREGKIAGHNADILLVKGGYLNNSKGGILVEKYLNLQGGLATNSNGFISANTNIIINTQGEILNNNDGQIQAVGTTHLVSSDLSNASGKLPAEIIQAGSFHNTEGKITGQEVGILLSNGSSLTNTKGEVLAERSLNLLGGISSNEEGVIAANNNANINTLGEILHNNSGNILALGSLNIESAELKNSRGIIASADKLQIKSQALDNSFGKVRSGNSIIANTNAINNNSGEIVINNATTKNDGIININTNGNAIQNEKGLIVADGDNKILASSLQNTEGKVTGQNTEIMLTRGGSLTNTKGEILAENSLNLQAGITNNEQGFIATNGNSNINTQGEILNNKEGTIQSFGAMDISSADLNNNAGNMISGNKLTIHSQSINNSFGEIAVNNLASKKDGSIDINTNGKSISNEQGKIIASGNYKIQSGIANNARGMISANGSGIIQTQGDHFISWFFRNCFLRFKNINGHIASDKELNIQSHGIDNTLGKIITNNDNKISANFINNTEGKIFAQKSEMAIQAGGNLTNKKGEVIAKKSLNLKGGLANNEQGLIATNGNAVIDTQGESLNNNKGTIQAHDSLDIASAELKNSFGNIASGNQLKIKSLSLDNSSGEIFTKNTNAHINIETSNNQINNQKGKIIASGDNHIHAKSIHNQDGNIEGENIKVTLSNHEMLNNKNGKFIAEKSLVLKNGEINNTNGLIGSKGIIEIDIQKNALVNEHGTLHAQNSMGIKSGILNNKAGTLFSGNSLSIDSNAVNNDSGIIVIENTSNFASNRFILNTNLDNLDNTDGKIIANVNTQIQTNELVNERGNIFSEKLDFTGKNIANNNGIIYSNSLLNIQANQLDNKNGDIVSKSNLTATVTSQIDNKSGKIRSMANSKINSQTIDNSSGGSFAALQNLDIQANSLNNTDGNLNAGNHANIGLSSLNNTNGSIYSQNSLLLNSNQFENASGQIIANGDLQLSTSTPSFGGSIISQKNAQLQISSHYTNTTQISTNNNLTITSPGFINNNKIVAGDNLVIQSSGKTITNAGSELVSNNTQVNSAGDFLNNGIVDGINVSIKAPDIKNKSRISGNNMLLEANAIENINKGMIVGASSQGTIQLKAARIINKEESQILSLGNIIFNADSLENISTKIAAQGNIQFNVANLTNKKEKFETVKIPLIEKNVKILIFDKGDILGVTKQEKSSDEKRSIEDHIKVDSPIGEILAGGNMSFSGNILNDKSKIAAAGNIHYDNAKLTPITFIGKKVITYDIGHYINHHREKKSTKNVWGGGFSSGHDTWTTDEDYILYDGVEKTYTLAEATLSGNSATGTLTGIDNINVSVSGNYAPAPQVNDSSKPQTPAGSSFQFAQTNQNRFVPFSNPVNEQHLGNSSNLAQTPFQNPNYPVESISALRLPQGNITRETSSVSLESVRTTAPKNQIFENIPPFSSPASLINVSLNPNQLNGRDIQNIPGSLNNTNIQIVGVSSHLPPTQKIENIPQNTSPTPLNIVSLNPNELNVGDIQIVAVSSPLPPTQKIENIEAQLPRSKEENSAANKGKTNQQSPESASPFLPKTNVEIAAASSALYYKKIESTPAAKINGDLIRISSQDFNYESPKNREAQFPKSAVPTSPFQRLTGNDFSRPLEIPKANIANVTTQVPKGETIASLNALQTTLASSSKFDGKPLFKVTVPNLNSIPEPHAYPIFLYLKSPTGNKFQFDQKSGPQFLVEKDPRFTNQNSFLGSDYYFKRMQINPERQFKVYGDGFDEQRSLGDNALATTGRKFLSNYTASENEFKALINSKTMVAKHFQISPGTGLSNEQMAILTTNMVTNVENKTNEVVVYLKNLHKNNLNSNGGLIAFRNMNLRVIGDVKNEGTFLTERGMLEADNIINDEGTFAGKNMNLVARQDIKNFSGQINGLGEGSNVFLKAGRDIIMKTKVNERNLYIGGVKQKDEYLGNIATVHGGNFHFEAGRDIKKTGVNINATGEFFQIAKRNIESRAVITEKDIKINMGNGAFISEQSNTHTAGKEKVGKKIIIIADKKVDYTGTDIISGGEGYVQGEDVFIGAAKDVNHSQTHLGYSYIGKYDESLVGGNLTIGGNFNVRATGEKLGNLDKDGKPLYKDGTGNITINGAKVTSEKGDVFFDANNDLNILAETTHHSRDEWSQSTSDNVISESTTTKQSGGHSTNVEGASVSGNNVYLKSGNKDKKIGDVNIVGSGVVASNDLKIIIPKKIRQQRVLLGRVFQALPSDKKKKMRGMETNPKMIWAPKWGSLGGNVVIDAGRKYYQSGSSDVIVPKGNFDVFAEKIKIENGTDVNESTQSKEVTIKGVNTAASNILLSSGQSLKSTHENSQKTTDPRMQALAAASAGMNIANSANSLGQDPKSLGGVKVTKTYGESYSSNSSAKKSTQSKESRILAGGNVNLHARGAGKDSNIEIVGSRVQAGDTLKLKAEGNVFAGASQSTIENLSKSESFNWDVGVGGVFGGGQKGVTLESSISGSNANAGSKQVSQNNSHIIGTNKLIIESGEDTNLIGAVAKGGKVSGYIGGNLYAKSLQDANTSWAKNHEYSANASICIPPVCAGSSSGGAFYGQTKIDSHYASVIEQSGIQAGDGGFQLKVKGHTQLDGAVISSSKKAEDEKLNILDTATFNYQDIENKAWYDASQFSGGLNYDANGGASFSPPIPMQASDDASNKTRSAVGKGTFIIRDEVGQLALTGKSSQETIAGIETENNALQIIPALIMAGELIVLAGTVYSANEVVDSLLEVSEGNKTFTELAKELTEEAVIDLVLDKATKGAWKIAKKTKSGKWIDSQADIFQEKGKEWLAKKGYSPNKIKFLERKFDDINDVREDDKELTVLRKWDDGKEWLDKNNPDLPTKKENLGTKKPYSSRDVREEVIDHHGKDNVKSTTVPPITKPNVRLAGKEKVIEVEVEREVWDDKKNDLVTKILKEDLRITFNKKGFPIFDDVTKVELRMSTEEFRKMTHDKQMVESTKMLSEMIKKGEIPSSQFTPRQLADIEKGMIKIDGYTWHHHEDTGRMQLVPSNIHSKVGHIGYEGMDKEFRNEK